MDLPTALAYSCDTYFYQLGNELLRAAERPRPAAAEVGRGVRLRQAHGNVDVGPEASGLVPTIRWKQLTYTKKTDPGHCGVDRLWKPGDSIELAIGQGNLLVTPLQMTRFYAMIANGGKLVTPHLLMDVENQNGTRGARAGAAGAEARQHRPGGAPGRPAGPLRGDAPARSARRTASSASFPVSIAGKTGTAREGRHAARATPASRTSRGGAATGRRTTPTIVVCALIENGGHGGTAAAPAAEQVFSAFFHVKAQQAGAIHSD